MVDRANVSFDIPAIRATLLGKMGSSSPSYPINIERRLPHILARLSETWGTAAADAYLEGLMFDDRQDRHGFPPEVAQELFVLMKLHSALGLTKEKGMFGWDAAGESAN